MSTVKQTQRIVLYICHMSPTWIPPSRTGTRNVLKAAAKAKVPRLVHMSSEAVLVNGDAPIVDADETEPLPNDPGFYAPYSKSKAMAERLVVVRTRSRCSFGCSEPLNATSLDDSIDDRLLKAPHLDSVKRCPQCIY